MINFTNTSLFFTALLAVSIGVHLVYGLSVWVYVSLYIVYTALFFRGAFSVNSNFFMDVLCAKVTTSKEIALSFDDGPGPYTAEILQILHDNDVAAAFFCVGKQIEIHPEVLQQIHQQGHLIGNHSYAHHFWFDCLSSGSMSKEMQQADALVQKLIGLKPKLFRPPYGVTLPWLRRAVLKGRYTTIGWSVRSLDTVITDEQKLLQKVTQALEPGAIFLFHDTKKVTAAILAGFLTQVRAKGYKVVRLDKLLELTAYDQT